MSPPLPRRRKLARANAGPSDRPVSPRSSLHALSLSRINGPTNPTQKVLRAHILVNGPTNYFSRFFPAGYQRTEVGGGCGYGGVPCPSRSGGASCRSCGPIPQPIGEDSAGRLRGVGILLGSLTEQGCTGRWSRARGHGGKFGLRCTAASRRSGAPVAFGASVATIWTERFRRGGLAIYRQDDSRTKKLSLRVRRGRRSRGPSRSSS